MTTVGAEVAEVTDWSRDLLRALCHAPHMTATARKPEPAPHSIDETSVGPLEHGEEWEAEIERRAGEVRSGRVQTIPCEEIAEKIRAEYGWR